MTIGICNYNRRRREARARVVCGCDVRMYNVIIVSFAFMWLFCAYNTLQRYGMINDYVRAIHFIIDALIDSYVTSLLPGDLGNVSLTVLYATVVATVLFTPWVTAKVD
jgi:hypothetical protein